MNEDISKKIIWNQACISGAVLGLLSTVLMFASQSMGNLQAGFGTLAISTLLWAIKFAGSIWLMMYFMKKLCRNYNNVTGAETFRFGMATALLSALIYSAAYLANITFINTDIIDETFKAVLQSSAGMLDSNSIAMMEKMQENFPQTAFFSNLIYCFLYGTLLSSILSRIIPPRDPFAGYRGENTDNQKQ